MTWRSHRADSPIRMPDEKDLPSEDRPDDDVASDVKETIAPIDVPKSHTTTRRSIEHLVEEEGGEATHGNR